MCRLLVCMVMAAFVAATAAAAAPVEGLYLSATGGYTMYDRSEAQVGGVDVPFDVDDGWQANAAVGWDFGPFRLEGEGGYRQNDVTVGLIVDDGELNLTSAMINVYADLPLTDQFEIYVGAGAGQVFSEFDLDIPGASEETDDSFCYQAMAGVAYHIERVTLFAGYRFFVVNDDLDVGDGASVDGPMIHSIEGGIRFTF